MGCQRKDLIWTGRAEVFSSEQCLNNLGCQNTLYNKTMQFSLARQTVFFLIYEPVPRSKS